MYGKICAQRAFLLLLLGMSITGTSVMAALRDRGVPSGFYPADGPRGLSSPCPVSTAVLTAVRGQYRIRYWRELPPAGNEVSGFLCAPSFCIRGPMVYPDGRGMFPVLAGESGYGYNRRPVGTAMTFCRSKVTTHHEDKLACLVTCQYKRFLMGSMTGAVLGTG